MEKQAQSVFYQVQDILGSFHFFMPELCLAITFLSVLGVSLIRKSQWLPVITGFAGVVLSLFFTYQQFNLSTVKSFHLFNDMIVLDNRAILFKLLFESALLLTYIFSLKDKGLHTSRKSLGEYFAVLIAMLLGLNLMSMASHLLMIYLSMEMVSICSYILAAYLSGTSRSAEAGMKYVLFGSASSAIMLYGISLLYGFTGTLDLSDGAFLAELSKAPVTGTSLAIILTLTGFAFKISAVPFHFWAPDVYQGAPLPVAAWLSVASKAAGFALLLRFTDVFTFQMGSYALIWPNFNWETAVAIAGILTMTAGNLSAIAQNNMKRMMAYSSIAHSGFVMMGIVVFSSSGEVAVVFYLFIYLLMNFAAFMFIGLFSNLYGTEDINDYKGLGLKHPFIATAMVIVLAALTGLPPTGGFVAKFSIFFPVVSTYTWSKSPWLMVFMIAGVINTVIALFYYFRIAWYMFLKEASVERPAVHKEYILKGTIIGLTLLILLTGLFPGVILHALESRLVPISPVFFSP